MVKGPSQPVMETYDWIKGDSFFPTTTVRRVQLARQDNRTTLIQADPDNDGQIWVGSEGNQAIQLEAGNSITIAIEAYQIWIRASDDTQRANILMLG